MTAPDPVAAPHPGPRPSGRLGAVLDAVRAGASTPGEVSRRSGLPVDLVRVALDHLVRAGRLQSDGAVGACAADGCGSCASGCQPAAGPVTLRLWTAR